MKNLFKYFKALLEKLTPYSCPTCNSYNSVQTKTGGYCRDCKNSWQYGKPIIEDDSFVEDGQRW